MDRRMKKLSKEQVQLVFPLLETLEEADRAVATTEVYRAVADKLHLDEEARTAPIPGLTGRYRKFDRDVRWAKELAEDIGLMRLGPVW